MKLLVLFFLVAVVSINAKPRWIRAKVDNASIRRSLANLDFSQYITKREMFSSDEDSDDDSEEITPSDATKKILKQIFSDPRWRELVILLADPEEMEDPDFRAKWLITEEDEKKRREDLGELTSNEVDSLVDFIVAGKLNAMIALSSTKEELLNPKYLNDNNLGELSADVANSDEDGNFFEGPQWKKFLELTGLEIEDDAEDFDKAVRLLTWMMEFRNRLLTLTSGTKRIQMKLV